MYCLRLFSWYSNKSLIAATVSPFIVFTTGRHTKTCSDTIMPGQHLGCHIYHFIVIFLVFVYTSAYSTRKYKFESCIFKSWYDHVLVTELEDNYVYFTMALL